MVLDQTSLIALRILAKNMGWDINMIVVRRILAATLLIAAAPAMAGPPSASLTAMTPANDAPMNAPVFKVTATFSGPVELKSLSVTGPRGESSLEQVLVEYGEKHPIANAYTFPLKIPVAAVGRYSINYMTWEARTKTSNSGSTSFAIGSAAELEEYDAALEKFDEAERVRKAEEEAKAEAEAEAEAGQ